MATTSLDADRRLSAEGLRDLLAVVNSSRGLDEILSYLVGQAHQVLGSDGVGLYLRDPNNADWLLIQAAHGVPSELVTLAAPVGSPIIGLAVSHSRSVVVPDFKSTVGRPPVESLDGQIEDRGTYLEVVRPGPASQDPGQRELNQRLAEIYRTIVAVPLIAREHVYGSLVLYYHAAHAYGQEQADLSLAFAQQAALAIENAHLRAEAEQRLREIERRQRVAEALRDLFKIVNSNHNLDEILAEVLAQSSRLLGNDASAFYLREAEDSDLLNARAALGLERDNLAREVRIGSPTTGLAVAQGRTLVCQDLQAAISAELRTSAETRLEEVGSFARITAFAANTDADLEQGDPESRVRRLVASFRAIMSTPLVVRGRVFGAITLFYAQPRVFTAEEVELARTFAEQATLAIENARLQAEEQQRRVENERRRRVAEGMRDLLATVNSTRSLDEILDRVLSQAAELLGSDAGSVLLLDDRDDQQHVLTVRASRALVSDIVPVKLPVGTAITGVAVERGRPVAVSDLLAAAPQPGRPDPQLDDQGNHLRLERIGDPPARLGGLDLPRVRDIARYYRALLAVPLIVRGQTQGAITLYYRRPREFAYEDVSLAQVFADQTALAMENARLHAQALQRTRDLEALYRADDALYRSLRLDQVLQALVDVAADALDADMTSVLVWDERHERLVPGATRGFRPEIVAQMSHAPGEGITTRVALSGEPIAVEDALNDPRVAHRITDSEGIRSLLHVPIKVNGEVFGVFGINYLQQRALAGEEERVLLALAHRAAVAIENAQLFAESQARLHELEALYRADEALHRSLRLDDVLHALADVATDVLRADKISVHMWDPDQQLLVTRASHGFSTSANAITLLPGLDPLVDEVMSDRVAVIADTLNDSRIRSAELRAIVEAEEIRSAIAAPISASGQVVGMFAVSFCASHAPTLDEQRLIQALAQRAGLAIANARLFEQAQQVATAEERQRLARELHDAVTQTLFSASLIAEVVPRLWERSPAEGQRRLDELRRLTRGALAEMRTLLLELRPAALVETPFGQLLRQLAEASASRTNLAIEVFSQADDVALPAEVQIALYRIAQEALNNTGKHAGATCAEIHYRQRGPVVDVHLLDNGRGFDPASTPPGHLGLGIMEERARAIGARVRIDSEPGAGTRVHVHWKGVAV